MIYNSDRARKSLECYSTKIVFLHDSDPYLLVFLKGSILSITVLLYFEFTLLVIIGFLCIKIIWTYLRLRCRENCDIHGWVLQLQLMFSCLSAYDLSNGSLFLIFSFQGYLILKCPTYIIEQLLNLIRLCSYNINICSRRRMVLCLLLSKYYTRKGKLIVLCSFLFSLLYTQVYIYIYIYLKII